MGPLQFGDTTLTKVFIGGLDGKPKRTSSATTSTNSHVTFKEAEAARKASKDPTPVINGRRANFNLASLGARWQVGKISLPAQPAPQSAMQLNKVAFGGSGGGLSTQRGMTFNAAWYYASAPTQARAVPFYAAFAAFRYSPAYVGATDLVCLVVE